MAVPMIARVYLDLKRRVRECNDFSIGIAAWTGSEKHSTFYREQELKIYKVLA